MEIPETREELLAEQQVLLTRIADARRRLAIVRVRPSSTARQRIRRQRR